MLWPCSFSFRTELTDSEVDSLSDAGRAPALLQRDVPERRNPSSVYEVSTNNLIFKVLTQWSGPKNTRQTVIMHTSDTELKTRRKHHSTTFYSSCDKG